MDFLCIFYLIFPDLGHLIQLWKITPFFYYIFSVSWEGRLPPPPAVAPGTFCQIYTLADVRGMNLAPPSNFLVPLWEADNFLLYLELFTIARGGIKVHQRNA